MIVFILILKKKILFFLFNNEEGDTISYYIVKQDKRITNAIQINMTKQQLEQTIEQVIECELAEKYLQLDYIVIRKLFSTFHLFSS